jgi:hypothetical protein
MVESFGWSADGVTGRWKSWHGHLIRIKLLSVDHSFLDRRSLAFHMAIAERLRTDPRLLGKVCDRLRALMQDSSVSISVRDAYREWLLFIERHSFDEVLALMVDPSEEGKRLRKATPFSGILSQEERAAITRKVVAAK